MFQTGASVRGRDSVAGTQVRTVLRFSEATVFAIDPFAGSIRCLRSLVEYSSHAGVAEFWFTGTSRSDSRRAQLVGRPNKF